MPIHDLYSNRNKQLPDVYQYNDISVSIRNQIVHIWNNFINQYNSYTYDSRSLPENDFYDSISKIIVIEHGLVDLPSEKYVSEPYSTRLPLYFRKLNVAPYILDVIEVAFRKIENIGVKTTHVTVKYTAKDAINELNSRFKQKGLGYEFVNGRIIRIDSQLLHAETVQPVLLFLNNQKFQSANDEYLKAHEHYRNNRYSECIHECAKSFESSMKIICGIRGWAYDKEKDTAKNLIEICINNQLIPKYLTEYFTGLRTTLLNGVPTTRNKTTGHGAGEEKKEIPQYLASYVLHLTAVSIKLLVEAHNSKT